MIKSKLFAKYSLIQVFSIFSLIAIVGITSFSGYIFFDFLKKQLLQREIAVTRDFIQNVSEINNLNPYFSSSRLSKDKVALEEFFRHITLIPDVIRATVYDKNKTIIWSDEPELIGKRFTDNDELDIALQGTSVYKEEYVNKNKKLEHTFLPEDVEGFIESYIPVKDTSRKKIIGVIELYKSPVELFNTLYAGKILVILVSLFGGTVLFFILYWIVQSASNTIYEQHNELLQQVDNLSKVLKKNKELQSKIQRASNRVAEIHEQSLRRVGSELHDGPAQSIGFALLRLDSISIDIKDNEVSRIQLALSDALKEIRTLSSGLAVPELDTLTPLEAVHKVVRNHQQRTSTEVLLHIETIPDLLSIPIKICVYRFIQEGLNNAFKHAKGFQQFVNVRFNGSMLIVEVIDNGNGFDVSKIKSEKGSGLGLYGLRERIESLAGIFEIKSNRKDGTKLRLSVFVPKL